LAIIVFAPLTGECAPVCLLAASISVEAVTPPFCYGKDCGQVLVVKDHCSLKPVSTLAECGRWSKH
jgi:hypothetical protein